MLSSHLWYYAYMIRNKLLDELRKDYVLLAKSKGLTRRQIVWRHCLRNVAPTIVSIMAISIPHITGGTVIVEAVFSYPESAIWLSKAPVPITICSCFPFSSPERLCFRKFRRAGYQRTNRSAHERKRGDQMVNDSFRLVGSEYRIHQPQPKSSLCASVSRIAFAFHDHFSFHRFRCIFAGQLANHDPTDFYLQNLNEAPSKEFFFELTLLDGTFIP